MKDEDGAFQEIVNKLTFDEKEGRYSVSIGDVEKNYAATLNAGELLWVSKGTYELSVSPVEEAAKEIVSSEDEKSVAEEETSSEESFSTEMETVTSEEITAEEETLTGESVTEESITPGAPLVSVTEENEETSTDAETEIEAETSAEESSEEETVSSAEETEAETTAETESETESVSEAETESELETASEVETETESESVTETETETTETVIETTSEEETETITETETEAVTEPETETETETETITEAEEEKTPWTVLRSDVRAEVTNPSVKEIFGLPLSEAADLSRNNSSVIYRDVFPGINYEYENFGYHVKETITVKEKQESYRYSFLLHAPELSARLTEEGEVLFTDSSEEEIFLLPKPWMKDAKGAESEEVFYEIEPVEEGWLLRIIADENWINDSERVSPVAIDPTIRIAQVYHDAFISATYINKGTPNTVHGKQALLYTGYDNYIKEHEIVMGFWYLPTLPENAVVDAAVLQMYHYSWTASTSGDAKLGMYAVENTSLGGETMRNWILSRSWNNTPDIVDSVLDYQTLNASTVNSWKNFDITRAMRTWYADSSNLPILRFRLINYADYQTMKPSLTFVAYRDAWVSAQPVFYLDYRIAAGLEDYYTAESVSIDRAGTAYITDLTRNMTLVKEVAGKASTAFPASVSLIYNSAFGPENLCYATDTASAFSSSKCGKGWKLSLQQTITADANPEYLRYLDADGTIHYFKKESGSSEYKDEDGLGLTITGSSSARTLKDAKNNQYKFNASGLLYEIVDQSGNKLNLTYNSSSQITALTRTQNGAGTENIASFSYDSDGYLASVTDSASRTTSFTYTSGGSLSMITHPDGTTAIYGYSGGTMSSAKDMESGYKIVWL
ncbi:MAG: RHS repeat protein, partial [Lachnospiraceae bacterium]|nr:RHS repeat protein [Lachnospiraceae bacterium]